MTAPAPTTAMVLAAGLGTRMRPLTDDRPKALVDLAGRALIDHVLDRLAEAGVTRAVVNVHWFADRLEAHLAARGRGPAITISDERAAWPISTASGPTMATPWAIWPGCGTRRGWMRFCCWPDGKDRSASRAAAISSWPTTVA